jgi:hypothetical protein
MKVYRVLLFYTRYNCRYICGAVLYQPFCIDEQTTHPPSESGQRIPAFTGLMNRLHVHLAKWWCCETRMFVFVLAHLILVSPALLSLYVFTTKHLCSVSRAKIWISKIAVKSKPKFFHLCSKNDLKYTFPK